MQPAVVVVEAAGLVDRHQHGQAVHARELEVLRAGAGRDVDDAVPSVECHLVPRDHAMLDAGCAASPSYGPSYREADELSPRARRTNVLSTGTRAPARPTRRSRADVLGIGFTAAATFAGQRPRGRRPDDERLARMVEQREADEQRRVAAVLVGADQLVLRDRGPAARAPDVRAVAHVEPAALVDGLEEPPDVLDVRVPEGVVVVVPVHPHPEPLGLLGDLLGVLGDRLDARSANAASPYSSISRFEFSPSARSTLTSTQRPWQSNPFW